jgi:hypothetical protein
MFSSNDTPAEEFVKPKEVQTSISIDRKPDPKDTGNGHTIAQVAEFRPPDVQIYIDYYKVVFERTKAYITTRLSSSDLQREVTSPTLAGC